MRRKRESKSRTGRISQEKLHADTVCIFPDKCIDQLHDRIDICLIPAACITAVFQPVFICDRDQDIRAAQCLLILIGSVVLRAGIVDAEFSYEGI